MRTKENARVNTLGSVATALLQSAPSAPTPPKPPVSSPTWPAPPTNLATARPQVQAALAALHRTQLDCLSARFEPKHPLLCDTQHTTYEAARSMDIAASQFQRLALLQANTNIQPNSCCGQHPALRTTHDHLAHRERLAQVAWLAFGKHQPLTDIAQTLAQQGVTVTPDTLGRWMGMLTQALLPLAARLQTQVLQSSVLHAREQTIHVLARNGDRVRAYVWAYGPSAAQGLQAVMYNLNLGRSTQQTKQIWGHCPTRHKRQRGSEHVPPKLACVMVDDHLPYKPLFESDTGRPFVTALGCWANVKRNFEALLANASCTLAAQALAYINDLYATEQHIRNRRLSASAALAARQQRALPTLHALHDLLLKHDVVLRYTMDPKLLAIKYCLNRWDALQRYAHSGHLPIDNTPMRNLEWPWAQPNHHRLFAGSASAGQRAAAMMSLLTSAQLNGLNPQTYIAKVIQHIPPSGTFTNTQLDALLPTNG
ncbi:transposase [Comamonadaceae bacterium M7527]|nr:transposase [Comamonadaceae bacterium M7527]